MYCPDYIKLRCCFWMGFQFMTTPDSEGELMLFESFLQAGVYCLPGTALFYGEPGWFRFTFTLPVQTLKQGEHNGLFVVVIFVFILGIHIGGYV